MNLLFRIFLMSIFSANAFCNQSDSKAETISSTNRIVTVKLKPNHFKDIDPQRITALLVCHDEYKRYEIERRITDTKFIRRLFERVHKLPLLNTEVVLNIAPPGPYAFVDEKDNVLACFKYYSGQEKLVPYKAHIEGNRVVIDELYDFFVIRIGAFSADIWDYLKEHPTGSPSKQ